MGELFPLLSSLILARALFSSSRSSNFVALLGHFRLPLMVLLCLMTMMLPHPDFWGLARMFVKVGLCRRSSNQKCIIRAYSIERCPFIHTSSAWHSFFIENKVLLLMKAGIPGTIRLRMVCLAINLGGISMLQYGGDTKFCAWCGTILPMKKIYVWRHI